MPRLNNISMNLMLLIDLNVVKDTQQWQCISMLYGAHFHDFTHQPFPVRGYSVSLVTNPVSSSRERDGCRRLGDRYTGCCVQEVDSFDEYRVLGIRVLARIDFVHIQDNIIWVRYCDEISPPPFACLTMLVPQRPKLKVISSNLNT